MAQPENIVTYPQEEIKHYFDSIERVGLPNLCATVEEYNLLTSELTRVLDYLARVKRDHYDIVGLNMEYLKALYRACTTAHEDSLEEMVKNVVTATEKVAQVKERRDHVVVVSETIQDYNSTLRIFMNHTKAIPDP